MCWIVLLGIPFLSFAVRTNDSLIWDVLSPEPVLLPYLVHLFNWDILGLGQEEVDEDSHDYNEASKEKEEAKLHVAKHGEENLSNGKCEDHVYCNIDGLSG